MKSIILSSLGLALVAAAAAPASALPQAAPLDRNAVFETIADSDFATKKDEYMDQVTQEMHDWGEKLHQAGEATESKAHQAADQASAGLDRAWSKTKDASRRLKAASAEQWDHAKVQFESAMQDLKDRWHKIHPEDE